MFAHQWFLWVGIYGAFALSTLSYFLNVGRGGVQRRTLQVFAAVVWPFYWLGVHGIAGALRILTISMGTVLRVFQEEICRKNRALLHSAYMIAAIATGGHYVWNAPVVTSNAEFIVSAIKTILWASLWPAYLAAQLF